MMHDHFRAAIELCDVGLVRKMWVHLFPRMPQPQTDEQARSQIHYARTLMEPIAFVLRAYSHAWLLDRGLPSGLPDELRPKAQRLYPITVGVVGIACLGSSEIGRQIAPIVQDAMSTAVLECYGDGEQSPAVVKPRMMEARKTVVRKLLGRWG